MFVIFFSCVCLISAVAGDDRTVSLTDSAPTVTWAPKDPERVIVQADDGYQIQVNVLYFNFEGAEDNYVSITVSNEEGIVSSTLILTYVLITPISYFYNVNQFTVEYVGDNPSNNFTIQFIRKGEPSTTTTAGSTSTTEALPTPEPQEKSTITVYLYGIAAKDFDRDTVENLADALTKMAVNYCSVQACPLNGTITQNNINIEKLQNCSVLWESYNTCVTLTFGIPVNILDEYQDHDLWHDYQLNHDHLTIMWNTYAESYLTALNLSLYPVPDIDSIFTHKIIMFSFILVLFIILILIVRRLTEKMYRKRSRNSLPVHEPDSVKKLSVPSLLPHYLQESPFIDDFNDNEYNTKKADTITIVGDLEPMGDETVL